MPEDTRSSALDGHIGEPRRLGAAASDRRREPGVVLAERRLRALAQLNGAPENGELARKLGGGLDPAPQPRRAALGDAFTLLWNGPGQWLVASTVHSPGDLRALLEQGLADTDATVTDLSQARTVLTLEGPRALDLLAKGCPLDVDALPIGYTAPSLLGHFNVQVHRRDAACLDLYVFRSFGLALWEWLVEEALEFGCEISP